LAEVGRKVIAVFGEKIVGCALKVIRGFFNDSFDFRLVTEGVALKDFLAECSTWWFVSGPELVFD
jgi:hypothetical protein